MQLKTFVIVFLLALSAHAHAACRAKNIVNADDEAKVVVPFAVPVGVPVAAFAPYFYGYRQFAMSAVSEAAVSEIAPARAHAQGVQALGLAREARPSLIATHCAACHSAAAPKAGLSLGSIDALSDADRFKAIRAVATGRMPKGETLTPEEARAIIQEFTEAWK